MSLTKFFESYQVNPSGDPWSLLVTDSSRRIWYLPRTNTTGYVLTVLSDGTIGWAAPTGGGGGSSNTFTDTPTIDFTLTGSDVTAAVKFPGLISSDSNNALTQGTDNKLFVNSSSFQHNTIGTGLSLIVAPGTNLSTNRDFRSITASSAAAKRGISVDLSTSTSEVEVSLPISTIPTLTPVDGTQVSNLKFVVYDPSTTSNYSIPFSSLVAAKNGLRYSTADTAIVKGSSSASAANGSQLTANTYTHLNNFVDAWIGGDGATRPPLQIESAGVIRFFHTLDSNAATSYVGRLERSTGKTYFGSVTNNSQLTQGTDSFNAGGTSNTVTGVSSFNGGGTSNVSSALHSATLGGYYLTSNSLASTVLGSANVVFTSQSASTFTATNLLFAIGNGSALDGTTKSNALTVLKNGRTQINTSSQATKTQSEVTPKAALEVVSVDSGIIPPMLTDAQASTLLASLSTPSFTKRIIDPSGAANNRVSQSSSDYNGDGSADSAGYYVDDREGAYFYNVERRTHQRIIWDPISAAHILQTF